MKDLIIRDEVAEVQPETNPALRAILEFLATSGITMKPTNTGVKTSLEAILSALVSKEGIDAIVERYELPMATLRIMLTQALKESQIADRTA